MRKTFILVLVMLSVGLIAGTAQGEETPLLRMLARIPNTSAARESLSYVDYRALIAARPGASTVSSWLEFELTSSIGGSGSRQLMAALIGIQSGPAFFSRSFPQGGAMAEAVGFDLFTIERAAEFGTPPETVAILEGDFDTDAVIAAQTARGYTEDDVGDLTLLCGVDGCDSGMNTNLRDRNPANPFGGEFGRSQPVLVGEQLVASSPSIEALDLTASTINGEGDSLADDTDYAAAAEAISTDGVLLQAYFIAPANIPPLSEALLDAVSMTAAEIKMLRATLAQNFVPMPPYSLIAIADAATDSEQLGLVALVYADQADAEAAAALFPAQLQDFESLLTHRPFGEHLAERGVSSIEATVYPASTGRSVMLLTLHAPLPEDEDAPSSVMFRLLAQAYFTRDLGWLATAF